MTTETCKTAAVAGGVPRLPHRVPAQTARELALTGGMITAEPTDEVVAPPHNAGRELARAGTHL
ncbi:hypothetical protein [Streptomyces botrytidirepellens]|uniref:Uncharacterized protein n=1 Tax=Streptomyces botrytidirepellens TaxID=2486417 RepID=A0A3M8SH14_9ACTN|nr:hypothetical protein [Streptomyces botrytidirepellens]RNF78232.1 hypothetical protein EEJ42_48965 [Streptomyces botrytidirepellens]